MYPLKNSSNLFGFVNFTVPFIHITMFNFAFYEKIISVIISKMTIDS
jgi:hypothetical protein